MSKFGKLGKLPIAPLRQPKGGVFAGRTIPRNRLDDMNWLRVLKLDPPPEDGAFVPRRAVLPQKPGKDKPKKKGWIYRIAEFMVEQERAAARSERNRGPLGETPLSAVRKIQPGENSGPTKSNSTGSPSSNPSPPAAKLTSKTSQDAPVVPTIPDWTELSTDTEVEYLGLEQLGPGETLSIVGAGITGLVTAWIVNRARPDVHIVVYDTNSDVGGWMKSTNDPTAGIFESGPRTLLPSHPGTEVLARLLAEIKARDTLMGGVPRDSPTNRKGLVFGGRIEALPASLRDTMGFLTRSPLLRGARWPLLGDLWRRARPTRVNDESVDSFLTRRIGRPLAERMASAVMRGIYAADSRQLSARSVARLGRLYYLERTEQMGVLGAMFSGSLRYLDAHTREALPVLFDALAPPADRRITTHSRQLVTPDAQPTASLYGFPGGIQGMARAIAADLRKRKNVQIRLGSRVESAERAKGGLTLRVAGEDGTAQDVHTHLLVSTMAHPQLFTSSPDAQALLGAQKYSSVAVVNVWVPASAAPDWFGVLVPRTEDKWNSEGVLGVVFDSHVRNAMRPVKPAEGAKKDAPEDVSKESAANEGAAASPADAIESIDKNASPTTEGSSMTVMVGGDLWPEGGLTAAEAETRALKFLTKLGILEPGQADAVKTHVALQTNAIPLYAVGHTARQHAVHAALQRDYRNRVALVGMAFGRGCGVSDCVVDALTLSSRFAEQRKLLYPQFYFNHWWSVTRPEYFA